MKVTERNATARSRGSLIVAAEELNSKTTCVPGSGVGWSVGSGMGVGVALAGARVGEGAGTKVGVGVNIGVSAGVAVTRGEAALAGVGVGTDSIVAVGGGALEGVGSDWVQAVTNPTPMSTMATQCNRMGGILSQGRDGLATASSQSLRFGRNHRER